MKAIKNTKITSSIGLVIILVMGLIFFRLTTVNAGDLEPSAPPGSTMKTLDEVEARTPISGSSTPVGTYNISKSGSYYLTGNRTCSGTGIAVNADNVTIDLNGYSLIGSGTGTYYGIQMSGKKNVRIVNGTIRSFGSHGIYEDDYTIGEFHQVINVRANGNGGTGVYLNSLDNLVKDCSCLSNGAHGIFANNNSTIVGNVAYQNTQTGIYTGAGCHIDRNISSINENSGIYTGGGSTISNNTVFSNAKHGIRGGSGAMILNNTVRSNNSDDSTSYAGIYAYTDCVVRGNTASFNKQYNIYTYSSDTAVENNFVTASIYGIYFNTAGCFYANNRASANTTSAYGGSLPVGEGDGGGNADF